MFRPVEEQLENKIRVIEEITSILNRNSSVRMLDKISIKLQEVNWLLKNSDNQVSIECSDTIKKLESCYTRLLYARPNYIHFLITYTMFREQKIKLGLDTITNVGQYYKNLIKNLTPTHPSSSIWLLRINFLHFCSNHDFQNEKVIQYGQQYLTEYKRLGRKSQLTDQFRARLLTIMAIEYSRKGNAEQSSERMALECLYNAIQADPFYAAIYSTLAHRYQDKAERLEQLGKKNKAIQFRLKAHELFELAKLLDSDRFDRLHPSAAIRQSFREVKVALNKLMEKEAKIKEYNEPISTDASDVHSPQKPFSWFATSDSAEESMEEEDDLTITPLQEAFNKQFPLYKIPVQTQMTFKQICFQEYCHQQLEKDINDDIIDEYIVSAKNYGEEAIAKRVEDKREEWRQNAKEIESKLSAQREAEKKVLKEKRIAASGLKANSSVFFGNTPQQTTVPELKATSSVFITASSKR